MLSDVVFDDGGTASGTFDYDADTNIFTDVNVTTTSGSLLSGANYVSSHSSSFNPGFSTGLRFLTAPPPSGHSGLTTLSIIFITLTNAGGIFDLLTGAGVTAREDTCLDVACDTRLIKRTVVSGTLSAVPLPAAGWLMMMALGLLGWRRQTIV